MGEVHLLTERALHILQIQGPKYRQPFLQFHASFLRFRIIQGYFVPSNRGLTQASLNLNEDLLAQILKVRPSCIQVFKSQLDLLFFSHSLSHLLSKLFYSLLKSQTVSCLVVA